MYNYLAFSIVAQVAFSFTQNIYNVAIYNYFSQT